MKNSKIYKSLTLAIATVMLAFLQLSALAQEEGGSSSSTTTTTRKVDINVETGSDWWTQPWVWIVGAAVFIILLAALLGGGSRRRSESSDRVTVTKTVERDTDV